MENMETLENTGPSAGFPGLLTITARAAGTAGTLLVVDDARLLSEKENIERIRIDYRKAACYRDKLRVFRCEYKDGIGVRFLNQEEELLCTVAFYKKQH